MFKVLLEGTAGTEVNIDMVPGLMKPTCKQRRQILNR